MNQIDNVVDALIYIESYLDSAADSEATTKNSFDAGYGNKAARQAHNLKVAGSNPAPATIFWSITC